MHLVSSSLGHRGSALTLLVDFPSSSKSEELKDCYVLMYPIDISLSL